MAPDRRLAALGLAVALLVAACSGDDGGDSAADVADETSATTNATTTTAPAAATTSPGCDGPGAGVMTGTTEHTMRSGGHRRQYQLIVPEDYDGDTPLPLVLGLHSLTVSHTFVAPGAGFADLEGPYDFIAAMPSGLVEPTPHWLAVPIEPNRDVEFVADLLDRLETDLCIDPTKVFSTGLSNGGQMSSVLACELPDRITAVAPIAGAEFPDTCDGDSVPVMAFHGDADPIVLYDGGGLDGATIANQNDWAGDVPPGVPHHLGVDDAMANWAEHNGCDPTPDEERVSPEVVRRAWPNCEAATVLYVIEGGGHNWPGHPVAGFEDQFGHTTTDIDATALMFEFFLGPPAP